MRRSERGFTLVEIMIVVAIIALLAAIAIPNVLRGRTSANESASIGNMRALVSSLEMYRSTNNVYPDTAGVAAPAWLAAMYGANCLAATQPAPDFGPPSFCLPLTGAGTGVGLVQGYNYIYSNGVGPAGATYAVIATPATVGTTGTRSFFVNQTGVVTHCPEPGGAVAATAANGPTWNTIDLPADGNNAAAGVQNCT